MGYERSHAIVVSSWNAKAIRRAHELAHAAGLGDLTTEIQDRRINSGGSFAVLPDGSKEGWDTSDEADAQRDAFVNSLKEFLYDDGSSPVEWVEVQFGDDEMETKVLRDGDELRRAMHAASKGAGDGR